MDPTFESLLWFKMNEPGCNGAKSSTAMPVLMSWKYGCWIGSGVDWSMIPSAMNVGGLRRCCLFIGFVSVNGATNDSLAMSLFVSIGLCTLLLLLSSGVAVVVVSKSSYWLSDIEEELSLCTMSCSSSSISVLLISPCSSSSYDSPSSSS
ncbi:hypothetical protein WICPIJ_006569 [Wickerhamomyces pijperi]|uniref:Transmembrane protein n=1 Tax=Wickerhamomyces pijperi TaxID=599730 RepID=A0A9P8TLA3_WICPI|nr:hypothetical protein WICPIJ_006569 [Wickerhamomyces pijperi]